MATHLDLFVYGPFFEGQLHDKWLRPYVIRRRSAIMLGKSYRLPVGYPVFVPEGEDRVPGQILELQGPDLLAQMLDQFHGVSLSQPNASIFDKITRIADCEGENVLVGVYAVPMDRLPKSASRISDGNWLGQGAAVDSALPERMSERQINYIRRLGASSGREIIPIDMDLYRELIKLELIVDKGRRLALTALGREVFRYLNI